MALLPLEAQNQPTLLTIRIVEGEGAVYAAGSRATRGVTIEVTDERGAPVEAVSVGFVLPAAGSSGTFASGSRSETQTTGPDGRAMVWGMRWNGLPGAVEIRISAVKGAARASAICEVQLDHAPVARESSGGGHKWLWIAVAVAGAAAGGGVAARGLGSSSPATTVVPTNPPHIGAASISLQKP